MKIPISRKYIGSEEKARAIEAINDGVWTEGKHCREFARKLSDYIGVKYIQLVNSGSSANLIALNACKVRKEWEDGAEVIVCALAFPTTINPVIQLGLEPVFVDCDGLNIDVGEVSEAVTDKTVAIMVAHTLGFPFDTKGLREICDEHGLMLIEDSCDALGSNVDGKMCGAIGDIATFSFYPAHMITTIEGGAVVTDDAKLFTIARSLSNWGRDCYCLPGHDNTCGRRFDGQRGKLPQGYDHKYTYSNIGYNLKMNDIEAAIGSVQMDKIDEIVSKRRENYTYYEERLHCDVEPLYDGVCPFGLVIYTHNAMEFARKLSEYDIGVRMLFGGNITRQPYLCEKYYEEGRFADADDIMRSAVWIGVQPGLTAEQLDYTIDVINNHI